ncbi:tripartite tricarboxylate transporter substrate binding protein [Pusillimonas sp. MFBS29]|uniref:tripartite tricarboxylate transporter substrate binding protein n=1 Tax=Pusillimonas sp. MFBS29 TaxID=2886690 RepID=UPI001D13026A|nr:tripartite tricarboxylate transporter substrate binding protein [Pusillimonas sp. MFBS29]MCC2597235.1 tripartite tricarboxylate transporter substrate binding protein [Pusillimonas sp. MFBS29]
MTAPVVMADNWPDRPIRMVVPYPPGGGTDIIARIMQEDLSKQLGQTVVIENRGGAAGMIGTEAVARADPDGYTVLFTLSSHTINPAIYKKLNFDTAKDFAPVSMVASLPQILVANKQFSANNVAELLEQARAKPGEISYGSVGNGSPSHIAGELLGLRTNTKMQHIPYRGGGPGINDVLGNQIPLLWVSIPAAAGFVKTGQLKALAVSTAKRSPMFPDVPTIQESGVPDFEVDSWYAMFVPSTTPQPVIDRLAKAVSVTVQKPEIKEKLLGQGAEAVGSTSAELNEVVTTELTKWASLAKEAHIQIN